MMPARSDEERAKWTMKHSRWQRAERTVAERGAGPRGSPDRVVRVALALAAALASLAPPCPVQAQPSTSPPRVAVVISTPSASGSVRLAAFQHALRTAGYVDGQTIVIDPRSWLGESRPLADLAAD